MDTSLLLALLLADVAFVALCARVGLRELRRRGAPAVESFAPRESAAILDTASGYDARPTGWVPGRAAAVLASLRLEEELV